MSELGVLLRNARTQRGLSLDDIQELTKIRKRYLEAIESGDHSILPGNFYVRAFVKSYSEAVGLDPDEVLRLYQHEVPSPPAEPAQEPLPVRKPRRVKSAGSEKFGKIGFNVLMWGFLFLIIAVLWYYAFNKEDGDADKLDNRTPITDASEPPPAEGSDSSPDPAETAPQATPEPTPPPATVTFNSKSGKADKYDIGPAGYVYTVELKVSGGRNWVEVRKGGSNGEKLYYANAEDGDVLTYELTEALYINVGRADYTDIRVNGVQVPDGDRSSSKKLLLQPLVEETDEGAEEGAGTNAAP